jgi:hypothetical protein
LPHPKSPPATRMVHSGLCHAIEDEKFAPRE